MSNNKFRDATRALDEADRIRPKAPEISEIRHQVRIAQQLAALKSIRTRAISLEKKEQWKEAIDAYDKALSIDQSAQFAVRGKVRAEKYMSLHDQIELYLNQPDRLNSPDPLAHARLVLDAADAIKTAGPRLKSNRDRLRQQISDADKPRPVLLRSDEKTEVTVYRVGRFGAFREKHLALRPGDYTAVGACPGFRDARVQFSVGRAETETVVVIKCTERI